ncbi:MAG: hypothetical protein JXQ96_10565 [Cyclobacteriaceae bacterium]
MRSEHNKRPGDVKNSEGDFYLENGFYVFKAQYHLKRGYCCENNCRHCPYGFKEKGGKAK